MSAVDRTRSSPPSHRRRPAARRHAGAASPRARTSPARAGRLPARRPRARCATRPNALGVPASVWRELRDRLPDAPEADARGDAAPARHAQWLMPLLQRARLRRASRPRPTGGISDGEATRRSRSATCGTRRARCTCSAGTPPLDKRTAGRRRARAAGDGAGAASTAPTTTCGALVTNGRQLRLLRDSTALVTAGLRRVRPGGHLRRRALSRLRAALPAAAPSPRFEVPEDDGSRSTTAGWRRWRSRRPISQGARALRPAPRRRAAGASRPSAPASCATREHSCGAARSRARSTPTTTRARCCGWSTGCSSWFVAEDRDAAASTRTPTRQARHRYAGYFSTARLRRLAAAPRAAPARRPVARPLGRPRRPRRRATAGPSWACPASAASSYDRRRADEPLARAASWPTTPCWRRSGALARSSTTQGQDAAAPVDYRNLGAEELGSIYESLLELVPRTATVDRHVRALEAVAGNDRKTTGSLLHARVADRAACSTPRSTRCSTTRKRGEASERPPSDARCSR